ncbi:forespore capture DNA-binding protein RefZ [Bacillus songklensis]|uniref:Forespore capture DNA-binding protein RefZ n=1 Tax=Bacillus songklensis TaxID=1069116 RepID=A0ABV8AZ32_9BACI
MAVKSRTKEKVLDAAVSLFNTKGFDGTSVREIAKKAKVNVANISYYFESKEGLLENLVTTFFEGYIKELEEAFICLEQQSAKQCLMTLIRYVMNYQHQHRHIARVVYREVSLDTTFIREVMTTYLAKEKYILASLLEKGIKQQEFKRSNIPYVIMQLKGMLTMPYLHSQYLSEVLYVLPHEPYFIDQYIKEMENWVHHVVCREQTRIYVNL